MHHKSERWTCRSCRRAFLSYQALQRHYDANPNHSRATLDVRDVEPDRGVGRWSDTEWIEFDDRIETFLALPETVEENDVTIAYRPSDECVEVSGSHEERIDTSGVVDVIGGDVSWRLAGRYLVISFPT